MTFRQSVIDRRAAVRSAARIEPLDPRWMMADVAASASDVAALHVPLSSDEYAEVGVNLASVYYYSNYWPFADLVKMESRGWMVGDKSGNGSVNVANLDATGNPTTAGTFNIKPLQNTGVPTRAPAGIYVLTWRGSADLKVSTNSGSYATLQEEQLGGDVKRRVYRITTGSTPVVTMTSPGDVTNEDGTVTDAVSDVHLWMPDPSSPGTKSLEPAAGETAPLFHPQYLATIRSLAEEVGYLRFMDWGSTNSSPLVEWADRRPANYQFASGEKNWKLLNIPGSTDATRFGNIGVPYEYMIALCNELNMNAWLTVPHAASDDFIRNLADLWAGKTDASPGLEPGLKLYLEHSNEIWSNGTAFTQGDWAKQESVRLGITKPQFTARRAVDVFRIFDQQFSSIPDGQGGTISRSNDIVRVAAAFTGQTTAYTTPYLAEMKRYSGEFEAAGEPGYMADTLAITTYFGGTSLTKYAFNESDWKNANLSDVNDPVINKVFDYWLNDLTLNNTGGGREGDAGAGGFGTSMNGLAEEYGLKLISYEGGPSIYTETVQVWVKDGKIVTSTTPGATSTYSLSGYAASMNGGVDKFTQMLSAMNRHPRIAEIYEATLTIGKAQGLKTHGAYNDISGWGKYGQWGTMEYIGQTVGYANGNAVKWKFMQDWAAEQAQIRDIDNVLGTAPTLPPTQTLPGVFLGKEYSQDILGTGGDGDSVTEIVAGKLPDGMTFTQTGNGTARISGVPTQAGRFRVLVRTLDADKDPAYAVYTIPTQANTAITDTFSPTADTFVQTNGSTGGSANGTKDPLFVGGGQRQAMLQYTVDAGIISEVDKAIIRINLRGYEDDPTKPNVPTSGTMYLAELSNLNRAETAPWTELGVRNETAPLPGAMIGSAVQFGASLPGFVEFDVTSYVRAKLAAAGGTGTIKISFAVRGSVVGGDNTSVGIKIASREGSSGANGAKLTISHAPPLPPAPPTVDIAPIEPNPTTAPVEAVQVVFNEPVTGLDVSDFVFTRNGTTINLSGLTLNSTDNVSYALSGLTPYNLKTGSYTIALAADSGVVNEKNTALVTPDAESWQVVSTVAARHIFYNNSAFDAAGANGDAGAADDAAIATDKLALEPGQTATFANYTSYSRGINGVMIDVNNLPDAGLTAADFTFKTGNNSTAADWATLATAPTITIRRGAGINGSDRVTLTWPDGTIQKTWLQVSLLANANTGLAAADTFYFGNAVGEGGDSMTDAGVNGTDVILARDNQRSIFNRPGILFNYDYNRDNLVNGDDIIIARDNQASIFTALRLITVPQ